MTPEAPARPQPRPQKRPKRLSFRQQQRRAAVERFKRVTERTAASAVWALPDADARLPGHRDWLMVRRWLDTHGVLSPAARPAGEAVR